MTKKTYYDITNLLKTDADYLMLLGQRANGKSYQVKDTVLKDAIFNDIKFVYLRRYKADIKTKAVEDYFTDFCTKENNLIKKYTKGKYSEILAHGEHIYLINRDKDGIIERDKKDIGIYCSLNQLERYKSRIYPDIRNIIYEEFITNELYLDDEPTLLQQFVSTILRLNKGHVFLIGNTLSRVCPYFKEWSLDKVLTQQPGTIDMYHYHVNINNIESVINIAVEYCAVTNNENTMFFGHAAKQIQGGEWEVHEYPKLPKKRYLYDKVYEIKLIYQSFQFIVELLIEPINGGKILYVYPSTKKREVYRVIQDEFSDLPNVSCKLDITKRPEALVHECIRLNKICYSDNLTGSDFSKCLEMLNKI